MVDETVNFIVSGFNAKNVIKTQRVKLSVSSKPNNANISVFIEAHVKVNIQISTECINIHGLLDKYSHVAFIKRTESSKFESLEVLINSITTTPSDWLSFLSRRF